jgi:hydrogenase-1 operon protein HyaF
MSEQPPSRLNPMIWHGEEEARGVFIGDVNEPTLLDMPQGIKPKRRPSLPPDYMPTTALRDVVTRIREALHKADARGTPVTLDVSHLSVTDRSALSDMLGDGEVTVVAGRDPLYQVQESVLTGVWSVRGEAADGTQVCDVIEIGDIPSIVRTIAASFGRGMPFVPSSLPPGAMNAPSVLAEIATRAREWRAGERNHVLNFTLLPLTEPDTDLITATLGQAPLTIVSGGYGTCRIIATAVAHVWAVQYLNAMGTVILDTVEIGDVPDAARADRIDFADSEERLGEIMEAYLS